MSCLPHGRAPPGSGAAVLLPKEPSAALAAAWGWGERVRTWWPQAPTNLAGLGIDVAHAEEPPDHVHVLLLLDGRQRCQHESGVAGFVLVVHVTDPCGDGQSGRAQGAARLVGGTDQATCLAPALPGALRAVPQTCWQVVIPIKSGLPKGCGGCPTLLPVHRHSLGQLSLPLYAGHGQEVTWGPERDGGRGRF